MSCPSSIYFVQCVQLSYVIVIPGDHMILYGTDFHNAESPTHITMRTISEEAESMDSSVLTVSEQLTMEIKRGLANQQKKVSAPLEDREPSPEPGLIHITWTDLLAHLPVWAR